MFEDGVSTLLWLAVGLGLLMAIVAVITGRHLSDELMLRPRAIYLVVAMLPVLVIGALAASAAINAAMRLILGPEAPPGTTLSGLPPDAPIDLGALGGQFGLDPQGVAVRQLVSSMIVVIIALAVYMLHLTWRRQLLAEPGLPGSPASRVVQAFAYTVVLAFVVALILSAYRTGYGVFSIIAPGTSGVFAMSESAVRERGVAEVVSGLALAAGSWFLLNMHWKLASTLQDPTAAAADPVGSS